MTAFTFDADDLDANRQGRLSPRQRVNLRATNQAGPLPRVLSVDDGPSGPTNY